MYKNLAHSLFTGKYSEVSTDSRKVTPGSIFFALQGDRFDAHQFIPEVAKAGASIIFYEPQKIDLVTLQAQYPKITWHEVPSTLQAIRALAKNYRSLFNIPLMGIVGSVGKTTSKEMLASILGGKYRFVLKTEGSQNGFLGIAITLLNLKPHHQAAVIEVGIDEIGAMEQHMDLAQPDTVLCTALGPEHLHQLKTVEIAAQEELKAFEYCLKHQKKIIANLDDPLILAFAQKHNLKKSETYFPYTLQMLYPSQASSIQNEIRVNQEKYTVPLPGVHHARNLTGAIETALACGLTPNEIKSGLATFQVAFGRTQITQKSILIDHLEVPITIIEDYYNSNPTSCEASLKLLSEYTQHKNSHPHKINIAILGDMLELGESEEFYHRNLARILHVLAIPYVFLYGPKMEWLNDELIKTKFPHSFKHFDSLEKLSQDLKKALALSTKSENVILLKGSRGMKMEQLLKHL